MSFRKRSRPSKQNIRVKENGGDSSGDEHADIVRADIRPKKSDITHATTKQSSEGTTTASTVYASSREVVPQQYAGDATHTSEIDTAADRDARAILERNIKLNNEEGGEGVYRGQGGYKTYMNKDISQVGSNKYTGTQGPIRAPAFVRSTARFDYQPDICKDYKETGFCGYGDNCKFLHDRGDYKSGWQLEKEWDELQARKKKKLEESLKGFGDEEDAPVGVVEGEDDDEYAINLSDEEGDGGPVDTDGLPFACFLCRDRFTDPVVTMCKHYFCGQCARDYSKNNKTTKCPACGKNTFGVFNKADKLARKLAKVKSTS